MKCIIFFKWKDCQRESDARINELLEENKRLSEQLNLATSQIGLFLTDKNPQINESMMAI